MENVTAFNVCVAALESLGVNTQENPAACAWAHTNGAKGAKPDGVSRIALTLAMQRVLLDPPDWLARDLPATPQARLQLLKVGKS
jgi:hypothetical protein